MEAEQLLNLFDSLWFDRNILRFPTSETPKNTQKDPAFSRTPTFISRSFSDQCLTSKDSLDSPNSVLIECKLQPILSGKEYIGFSEEGETKEDLNLGAKNRGKKKKKKKVKGGIGNSKSLSELEFEELKGFMDLGFVFSDKDKDSSTLVSIIPGLQRLGRGETEEEEQGICDSGIAVSRPYLSEAWDVLGEKKKKYENSLMNLRISAVVGNEMEMKNQLRFWAHSVASNVR